LSSAAPAAVSVLSALTIELSAVTRSFMPVVIALVGSVKLIVVGLPLLVPVRLSEIPGAASVIEFDGEVRLTPSRI
jgi:hypothetical protein